MNYKKSAKIRITSTLALQDGGHGDLACGSEADGATNVGEVLIGSKCQTSIRKAFMAVRNSGMPSLEAAVSMRTTLRRHAGSGEIGSRNGSADYPTDSVPFGFAVGIGTACAIRTRH